MQTAKEITSLQNPEVKHILKLGSKRSARDASHELLVEGYREGLRAVEAGWKPSAIYFCEDCFLGSNEYSLLERAAGTGARLVRCSKAVFEKMAYRDRPEGLLMLGPELASSLDGLQLPERPLLLVAEAIEKPGNLGTMLRTADAAGMHAVIVADPKTDLYNPNVVRASTGTLFTVPLARADSVAVIGWLRNQAIHILAATPHAETLYTGADLRGPTAIVVGTEQYGLSKAWMDAADTKVRIPMAGRADSLNVAAAATILAFEALRQRQTAQAHK